MRSTLFFTAPHLNSHLKSNIPPIEKDDQSLDEGDDSKLDEPDAVEGSQDDE